jgi:ATP-dependent RNA helicase DeaD
VSENESENPATEEPATPQVSFADLGLSESVIATLSSLGWKNPTEVQAKAIPQAIAGRDLQVQSRTGSGKTAAFGIPFAQSLLRADQPTTQALVLAPTRELALQVAEECTRIAAGSGLRVAAIYGGAAMGPQVSALREGAQLVAGTPGRVLDHIRRGNLRTGTIRTLVLDECDEMLSMGFYEEISSIINELPVERQTMLFSATIPEEIQKMADRYLKDPVRLYLSEDFIGVREIQHIYYLITGSDRPADLLRVLEYENPELALVFCNTRDDTALVADFLRNHGFQAENISSDLSQSERERVMQRMRAGELRFLVATDIAARGIDLTDLTHVINYTFPESADVYVHRTGRTGRAGKSGIAVSLVSPREIGSFYYLKLIHKIFPEERHLPSAGELATRREAERVERLRARFANVTASEELRAMARRLWTTLDGERLTALALAALLEERGEIMPLLPPAPPRERAPERERERDREDRPRDDRGRDGRRGPPRRGRERERDERPRRREDGPPRARSSRSRDRDSSGGDREPRAFAGDAEPRERKTTRSFRRDPAPAVEDGERGGAFAMPDGDVERWELVEPGAAPAPAAAPADEGSDVRLFINVGKRQGARVDELVDFVVREALLEVEKVTDPKVRESHSFVSVPAVAADEVIARLTGKSFGDRVLRIERAKPRSTEG